MSLDTPGFLPRTLVVAALSTKRRPDPGRHRGWMRRRGLDQTATAATERGEVCIDSQLDFVHCYQPGCCALRPVDAATCPVCGRN